ncbi:MAG TPA: hypothetical protein PKA84_01610 [Rubrivivax sp.]|nr:hypothetical protein [Rubrivivax sp.]HMR68904.1 hypothetical protein [Rubrivivax sp.]
MRAWNLLATGAGGFDWAGLPLVCGLLGVREPEMLIERLLIIKTHRPPGRE